MNNELINKNINDLGKDIAEICKEYEDDLEAEKIMYVLLRLGFALYREIIKEHPQEEEYMELVLKKAIDQGVGND